ncbi:MAG: hypothetical protein JRH20_21275, partial [Deltaproteobacteria bacterium]|nr:hypothetical protein [Deltaproteobacteria bacterium]
TLKGQNFFILVKTSFDDDNNQTNDAFSVHLRGAAGEFALEEVVRNDVETIRAVVPAGLPQGRYDVIVQDPRGRSALLQDGFTLGDVVDLGTSPDARPDTSADLRGDSLPLDASADLGDATQDASQDLQADGGVDTTQDAPRDLPVDMSVDMPSPDMPQLDTPSPDLAPSGSVVMALLEPLGANTNFAFVLKYDDKIYLGPTHDGTGAVRANADGSNPEAITFSFAKDTVGSQHKNSSPGPYPSIGSTACLEDTPTCGPDNEDGRGIFTGGIIGGVEWLLVAGSKTGGDLDYVYMTPDKDDVLDFRYVDLATRLGGNTAGVSAMHVFADRVYIGFPDTGGNRPYLVSLSVSPPIPGLDVTNEAADLRASSMPNFDESNPAMIDTIGDFGGLLYLFNNGGCMRSRIATPGPFTKDSTDWTVCTPSAQAYAAKVAVSTTKVSELEPADKAFPQMAAFGGRLYVGRNTTDGPQLWACDPGASPGCDPDAWVLVAPNQSGDAQLTQFDNVNNTRISLVVSTPNHLYVGFDNVTDGAVIFRTAHAGAALAGDFSGAMGCSAADHPASCPGLGQNGLGRGTANSRIMHGVATTFDAKDFVYLSVGDGTTGVSVYRIVD